MVIDASFIINCCITLKKLQDKSPLFRIAESEVIIAQEIFEHIEEENSALQILSVDSPRKSVSQISSCNGTLFKIIV